VPPAAPHASCASVPSEDAAELDDVLEVVRARCGTSFAGYRRPTLERRIRNRMISAGARSVRHYLAVLRADPREPDRLLERLTLKVSRLWRNAHAVDAVARALGERPPPDAGLAAWSAGCARGEEAYTLAILLSAASPGAWRVLGTDLDSAALAAAARARYGPDALVEVPTAISDRFLGPPGPDGLREVLGPARAGVRLERHDLVATPGPPAGAPFDLVACRNVLIYLDGPARLRVEGLLHRAVAPGGLLWLGEAEWPAPELAAGLEVVDRRARLFRRRIDP
jgi:chemotaxis protein methyltransferase CheR